MFRVGLNDCTGEGDFFRYQSSPHRYNWMREEFKFTHQPPVIDKNGPILFLLQSEKGWQYNEKMPFNEWAYSKVKEIREITDREIVLRTHPNRNKKHISEYMKEFDNISYSEAEIHRVSLLQDLLRCTAVVTHSSSAACEAHVLGLPTFALDKRCVVYHDVENDLKLLNDPESYFDKYTEQRRLQSYYNWSYTSWKNVEMASPGFVEYYIKKALRRIKK